jgi:hypothetical protein
MTRLLTYFWLALLLAVSAHAAELRAPAQVKAGSALSLTSDGSGEATLYLVGPASVSKRKVQLGGGIPIQSNEVQHAGRYAAVVCSGGNCASANFYVVASDASKLSLLVHPSRVRVATPNSISAVAFVFDKFHNLVLSASNVEFKAIPQQGTALTHSQPTSNGVAWIRLTSAAKEGPAKIGASVANASELRVVRQVASDACNLRIKSEWVSRKLFVQTDPVRDCSGNNVPDGTVVSFTKTDAAGKTTVDAPIKRGTARVEMPLSGEARIDVASGVVTGNELNVGGAR